MTTILPFYNNLNGRGDSDYGMTKSLIEDLLETYNNIIHMGVNSPIRTMEKALDMVGDEMVRKHIIEDAINDKRWLENASRRLWHQYEVEKFSGRFGDMIIISRLAKFGPLTLGPLNHIEAKEVDFWTDMESRHAFAGDVAHDRWVLLETQEPTLLDESFNEKWRLVADACEMKFFDWSV